MVACASKKSKGKVIKMNLENVKALADVLNTKGLSAIEVGEGDSRIRIEKDITGTSSPVQTANITAKTPAAENESSSAEKQTESTAENTAIIISAETGNVTEIKSPLVGVYYAAPSPEAETFVSIGSKIKKGDVLCIIETMKLMNEITAEQDGEIIDICMKNGDTAEYGQILFKLAT